MEGAGEEGQAAGEGEQDPREADPSLVRAGRALGAAKEEGFAVGGGGQVEEDLLLAVLEA